MTIGVVWNPTKTDRETLEAALHEAWLEVRDLGAAEDPATLAALERSSGDLSQQALWFETSLAVAEQSPTERALEAGCTSLVAAGGDGTVREVAEHLAAHVANLALTPAPEVGRAETIVPTLGIVPLGTGNLLARNLGIPLNDPVAAFRRIMTTDPTPLDMGLLHATFLDGSVDTFKFMVMAGFGIDAQMIVETDDDLKSKAGWLAYVESLGRAVSNTEVTGFSLSIDDDETVLDEAHTLLIGNCGTLQAGFSLLPDAVPDDGKLDLLVLRADGIASWLDTLQNMVWDNGLMRLIRGSDEAASSDSTGHGQAERVTVELSAPLQFEVDGEDIGEITGFTAEVLAGALSVR